MSELQYLYPTAWAIGSTLLYLYLLWIFFIVAMAFYRAKKRGQLHKVALVLGSPLIVSAWLGDLIGNLTIAWLVFLEAPRIWRTPREWLITKRLQRYIRSGTGWRYWVAKVLCTVFLDPFDITGSHCVSDQDIAAQEAKG